MKKDVFEYFIGVQKQYNEMNKMLGKVNEEIEAGLVSNEQRENFEKYFNAIKNNYDRVAYIIHLLNLPPKPVRRIREFITKRQSERDIEKALKEFKEANATKEDVIEENEEYLNLIKDDIGSEGL